MENNKRVIKSSKEIIEEGNRDEMQNKIFAVLFRIDSLWRKQPKTTFIEFMNHLILPPEMDDEALIKLLDKLLEFYEKGKKDGCKK